MRLIFEIGVEELPARFLQNALKELSTNLDKKLKDNRIDYESIKTYGTPRRLVLDVAGIADKQRDLNEVNYGPAKSVAYSADGEISKAGLGFAKSQGVEVSDLTIEKTDKGEYIVARKHAEGKETKGMLPQILQSCVLEQTFPKSMKWSDKKIRFARPIQWILAVCDGDVVPFDIEGIQSGNVSHGHRFFGHQFTVTSAEEYFTKIRENNVIVDIAERKEMIRKEVSAAVDASKEKVLISEGLLDEVTNLVEYPYAILGSFNSDFLEVPQEVLIISMEVHQRYFPVVDLDGKLQPKFVAVRNGISDSDKVRKGNEKVLSARLADARFFYQEDLKAPLENNVEKLKTVVFQKDLGTIYEKIERDAILATYICDVTGTNPDLDKVLRTVKLAKADLVSNMIGEKEFTKLQGFMGENYALKNGEDKDVAAGIREHYYPRFAGDELPQTIEGKIAGISDRIDTLVGCFGVGVIPSGSKDPFALRRAALGALNIILDSKFALSLSALVDKSLETLENQGKLMRPKAEVHDEVMNFLTQRAINILSDLDYSRDVINAVVTRNFDNLTEAAAIVTSVSLFAQTSSFTDFLPTLKRVENISKEYKGDKVVDPQYFEKDIERELRDYAMTLDTDTNDLLANKEYTKFCEAICGAKSIIDSYFEQIMVMSDNANVKNNRLAQMKILADIFNKIADLNMIG